MIRGSSHALFNNSHPYFHIIPQAKLLPSEEMPAEDDTAEESETSALDDTSVAKGDNIAAVSVVSTLEEVCITSITWSFHYIRSFSFTIFY